MNIRALIYQDLLLLLRDVWGIVLLFFMPWALVLLMAYLQDGTFRSINENRISLYLLNADGDSLGRRVSRQLSASRIFDDRSGWPVSHGPRGGRGCYAR